MQPTAEDTIITAHGEMINFVAFDITRNGIEPYVPKSFIQAQEILTLCDRENPNSWQITNRAHLDQPLSALDMTQNMVYKYL